MSPCPCGWVSSQVLSRWWSKVMVALARTWLSHPVLLSRASPTILHEAQTGSSGSKHNDEDEPLATGFMTLFAGKFGGLGGRESTASPGISAGWVLAPWGQRLPVAEADRQRCPHKAPHAQRGGAGIWLGHPAPLGCPEL